MILAVGCAQTNCPGSVVGSELGSRGCAERLCRAATGGGVIENRLCREGSAVAAELQSVNRRIISNDDNPLETGTGAGS